MGELSNCPNCNALFVKTEINDVCRDCYKEEEALFQKVYEFIRKKENRTATMQEVEDGTGVEQELISKWIRNGKLKVAGMQNLGYKCEKCGTLIKLGKLCEPCKKGIQNELTKLDQEEEKKKSQKRATYFS
jgi:flagellar operon protein (TIGR03826 family)